MDVSEEIRRTIRSVPNFPKPGIQFKDITPIMESPVLSRAIVHAIAKLFEGVKIDAVAGVESRGFLFGLPLAMELNVPFIVIRKKGKLPAETVSYKYVLEYGEAEIEMHKGAVRPGMNVLVHDDLLATGGTAGAAAKLIEMEGGHIAGFSFLIELQALNGKSNLVAFDRPVLSLTSFE